jgi:hypothetical protein
VRRIRAPKQAGDKTAVVFKRLFSPRARVKKPRAFSLRRAVL